MNNEREVILGMLQIDWFVWNPTILNNAFYKSVYVSFVIHII